MNVLMVGIQDVTSNYIADRFVREGHKLTWFTAQTPQEEKPRLRGKIYHHDYDVRSLLRVLQMHDIDTVVFHYGSYRGTVEEESRDESRIPALQCLLSAMGTYPRVKQLVYLSTVELVHQNISTPRMAEMSFGEALVEYHAQSQNTSVIILRIGMDYGEGKLSGMGYMGIAIQKILEGQVVETRCYPDSYVDLVYAGDVAMAVYRLLVHECSGLYYCLTGRALTMQQLHDELGRLLHMPVNVHYKEEEQTLAPDQYLTLSQSLRTDAGWFPLCLPDNERGKNNLAQITARATAEKAERETEKREKFSLRKWWKAHPYMRGLLETLAIFVLTMFVSQWLENGSIQARYIDVRLLFVVLISMQYGVRLGTVAVMLACIGYLFSLGAAGIDFSYLLYGVETWIPFIIYAVCGALVGYIADLRTDSIAELEEKNEMLRDRYDFLKQLQKETIDVKAQLQQQLSSSKESFGKVYQISERLNTLNPDEMLYQSVEVLADVMGGCEAAVWMLSDTGRFARRKASTKKLLDVLSNTLVMQNYPLITEEFSKQNLFVNTAMDPKYPDFAVPIYRDNRPIAFAALYHVPPERFAVYYQNLFKVVVGLIENGLVRAMLYTEQTAEHVCVPDTIFLQQTAFAATLALMREQQEKGHVSYVLLQVVQKNFSLGDLSEKLVSLIRADDTAGINEAGQPCVLLLNAAQADVSVIQRRFASKGVEVLQC